ncbi:MAG: hypothetical protein ACYDED_15020, partial [Ferrimicrobium sp.]
QLQELSQYAFLLFPWVDLLHDSSILALCMTVVDLPVRSLTARAEDRQTKGSNRRKRTKLAISKLSAKESDRRKDWT